MFSKASEYALRATIYIAQKSSIENKLGIDEIAQAIDSPKPFTAKILQTLSKDKKIISSVRGKNGGFYISEKALKLPIIAVLVAQGEDSILEKCVLGLNKCSETNPCPMHDQYKNIKKQLIHLFETKTIEQLAISMKDGEKYIRNE
ncbi:MAG: Rrf2 family transcriptional regulator [Bacteroidia bacterium]|nr:Rrf2 family transcriptional regulator [Bacteroidia bacterium]